VGTGARTPKPDEYPEQLRVELTQLRDQGIDSFTTAWAITVQTLGIPEGWDRPYPDQPDETPLAFAERHFRAAWYGQVAGRYCQVEGCFNLTNKRVCSSCRRAGRTATMTLIAA